MKLPLIALLLLVITACNNAGKKETASMPGAYKMLYQKVKGGKTDTTFTSLLQQKIYTDDYMMYANFNPSDSASSFGIGTYTMIGDTVTEKVFYNGADSTKTDAIHNFKLVIEKTAIGYKQIIPEIESQGEKFILTEDYENIGKKETNSIDGAWKMGKSWWVKGKDSTVNTSVQFKVYYMGHFIWGHTWEDSTKKTHTGIGFGTFTMNGTDKITEKLPVSTYADARNKDYVIELAMNGADAFTQTIVNKDSSRQVEMYTRLKK